MQEIINFARICKKLEKQNLKIDNPKKLKKWIFDYNFFTIFDSCSNPFFSNVQRKVYAKRATSNQIINLYEFDFNFRNHVLRDILRIEKKINTHLAYAIINYFSIKDHCLLKFDMSFIKSKIFPNFNLIEPKLDFNDFISLLISRCESNSVTKKFKKKGNNGVELWKNLPLDLMCLTWSFSTVINVFVALNDSVSNIILTSLGLDNKQVSGFIDFLKNILRLRNLISHSYVIYDLEVKYQSSPLNKFFSSIFKEDVSKFNFFHLVKLIEHFSGDQNLILNSKKHFDRLDILPEFKKRIKLFRK